MKPLQWKRSSRCEGGQCWAAAQLPDGRIAVRNDAQPDTVIVGSRAEISAWVAGWIAGEFAPEATR